MILPSGHFLHVRTRFAWLPTRVEGGGYVWLRTFEQREVWDGLTLLSWVRRRIGGPRA